jgi:hypothetical protein
MMLRKKITFSNYFSFLIITTHFYFHHFCIYQLAHSLFIYFCVTISSFLGLSTNRFSSILI